MAAPAREAVAADYARRGAAVDPGHVVLTASTSEAYAHLFKVLCDPGDAVLVPRPSYPLFQFLADLESMAIEPYPVTYDGTWHLRPSDIAAAVGAADPRRRRRDPEQSHRRLHEEGRVARRSPTSAPRAASP